MKVPLNMGRVVAETYARLYVKELFKGRPLPLVRQSGKSTNRNEPQRR